LGVACHDVQGRTGAALGQIGPVEPRFKAAVDVPGAGVLCAVPALVSNGLFHGVGERFEQPRGYYPLPSLFLLFAYMALARVKSLEQVRYLPPGEQGRILGLDRIPEVRTLRHKLGALADAGATPDWAEALSRLWMTSDERLAGLLYVDGHVRAYHGAQTELPRRYSSRDRLCLRSLMDYWVCDQKGSPFFVLTAMGTEGLLHHLRTTILPRLCRDVPGQPDEAALLADPDRHRFTVVIDREGYSPAFFAELWRERRVAIQTYRRGEVKPWPLEDFHEQGVPTVHGNETVMLLAERPVEFQGTEGVALREIRRLSADRTHQTAILTTDRRTPTAQIAGHMFSRWAQENFFKYAARELAIDSLAGYKPMAAPETETVRNPDYNRLDAELRRRRQERAALLAQHTRWILAETSPEAVAKHMDRLVDCRQRLGRMDFEMAELRKQRRATPRRVALKDLPEDQRPKLISPRRTQFLNTIRIIAYRAETALASVLRDHLAHADDARNLLKDLFTHDADLIPNTQSGTLTVRLHHFTNPQAGKAMTGLLQHLNETETVYPGTNLTLRYEFVSSPIPADQEV
jgi:hypothetical protein